MKCFYYPKRDCIENSCFYDGINQPHGYAGDDCKHRDNEMSKDATLFGDFALWAPITLGIVMIIYAIIILLL